MRPPPLPREYEIDHRFTPEEMRAFFKPCPLCGAIEQWNHESRRFENPVHDYSKHPGLSRAEGKRLTTEELMQLPEATAFDRLGDRREA